MAPSIENNVTLFAESMIIGKVNLGNDVRIVANSLVLKDNVETGDYVGSPAKK